MKKYRVTFTPIYRYFDVDVEAETKQEALKLAQIEADNTRGYDAYEEDVEEIED